MTRHLRCPRPAIGLIALLAFWLGAASNAHAHKVTVVAWVEGETGHTESKFSGGRRARQATIEVYDDQDQRLLTGQTDDNGQFSFKIPQASALRIVLRAGMGHQNEWRLDQTEIRHGLALSDDATRPAATAAPPPAPPPAAEPTGFTPEPTNTLSPEALERIVAQTLDRKLQPIMSTLAEIRQPGPSLQDILGGIGYILGLVGLGAYLHRRRR